MQRRVFGANQPTVKIDGHSYVLRTQAGKPVYSTGTRAIEGVGTDEDRIVIDDWSGSVGGDPYVTDNCLTGMPGRLMPGPPVNYLSYTPAAGAESYVRHWFEEQGPDGTWYLYGIAAKHIVKVALLATPIVRNVVTPNTAAFFGQPAKAMTEVAADTARWFLPADRADTVYRLDAITNDAANDTWTFVSLNIAGEEGAAHLLQLPNGKIARVVAFRGLSGALMRCKVSLLPARAAFEATANWGEAFAVSHQHLFATGLTNVDEFLIVHKQDGAYIASESSDGTLFWRNLLPDAMSYGILTPQEINVHKGIVWHGRVYLPSDQNLWRHNLATALPVGPGMTPGNLGDEPNITGQLRFGRIPTLEHLGEYMAGPFNLRNDGGYYMMLAREPQVGEAQTGELSWAALGTPVANLESHSVHRQLNGAGMNRLYWQDYNATTGAHRIAYMDLGEDLSPFRVGGSYGAASSSGFSISREYPFPARALFREARLEVEAANAEIDWNIGVYIDGGTLQSIGARSDTGSVFWTAGTADTARRVRLRLGWASTASYVAAGNRSRLRRVTVEFTHLPDVGDPLLFVVDLAETAKRWRSSETAVRDRLRALRTDGVKAFVDVRGTAGQVLVTDVADGAPKQMASLRPEDAATVQAMLQEYS